MAANGTSHTTNGHKEKSINEKPLDRANEVDDLLNAVQKLIIPFIKKADEDADHKHEGDGRSLAKGGQSSNILDHYEPTELVQRMKFELPAGQGKGKEGLLNVAETLLKYSVNTWDQGFLDKLYASTNAPGVVAELLLAVLNTNLHVYHVSPALTVIEKTTARTFANLYGFNGPHAGGISTQGGSASNTTAIIIARNNLYPSTKTDGNGTHNFVLFTSQHGHYSLEKAAQMCGLGSSAAWSVAVDEKGCMIPSDLERLIQLAKSQNKTPLFVNATAGTTVLGSYDPFPQLSKICKKYNLWLHIDGSWGGPVIFSITHASKMHGSELADSIAVNPHKMLGTPLTCSFLLGPDLRKFHAANTLPAGYLFHNSDDANAEVWDLADLTLQCGRRGDSLKLALGWIYYGQAGYAAQIDHAFDMAKYMCDLLSGKEGFILVSENPPPCLQVCFYYVGKEGLSGDKAVNTKRTREIVERLVARGFMVDYSPGERGSFFRVVVNVQTRRGTVEGLVKAIVEVGEEV